MLYESIVLFGSAAGERMEPVGIMTRTIVDRPTLHSVCNTVSYLPAKGFAVVDCLDKGIKRLFRKILKHLLAVEHLFAIIGFHSLFGELHFHSFASGSLLHTFES